MADTPPGFTLCPACQVGHLKALHKTYIQVYEGTLVTVPDVLAWECDVCGLSFYDPAMLRRVEVLIGEAGPPPNQYTPPAPRRSDEAPGTLDDPPKKSQPRPE